MHRYLLYLYLLVIIFTGTLNPIKYRLFISYVDLSNLLLLLYFLIYGLLNKRKYIFNLYKTDIILLFCIVFLTIPSIIFNDKINTGYLFKHFYPIRILITYKIMHFIFYERLIESKKDLVIDDYFKPIILLSIISALLSIIRYLPIQIGFLINDIWPIFSNGEILSQLYWGRLWGTMGGTNSAGNYFTILALISLYNLYFNKIKWYLFPYLLFTICVILSLSFTSIISYIVGVIYIFSKKISFNAIIMSFFIITISLVLVWQNETLKTLVQKRVGANVSSGSIVPKNLQTRMGYWKNFLRLSSENERLNFLYGFGPGGARIHSRNKEFKIHGNPESFYFRIYNEAGFIGIFTFVFLFYYSIRKLILCRKRGQFNEKEKIFIILIFLLILVQSIANEPLYSNGITQIFCFLLFYISYNYNKVELNQKLQQLQ